MPRLALVGLCVVALCGVAAAQGGPPSNPGDGVPADCTLIEGDFSVTSTTVDTIEIALTGDVEGTLVGTISEQNDVAIGVGSISVIHFSGTVTGATGTLEVSGRLFMISLGATDDMGNPVGPQGSLTSLKLLVTGGTGDYDGNTGIVVGFDSTFGMGLPWMDNGYRGVLCAPATPPMP